MKCSKSFRYFLRGGLALVSFLLLLVLAVGIYAAVLYGQADYREPAISIDREEFTLTHRSDSLRICGENHLLLNRYGLWESRIGGSPVERGAAFGAMGEDLLYFQEKVFVDQIRKFVPSDFYLKFLRTLIEIFNRDMAENIPEEYIDEIYAMSLFCTHEYDIFGNPYERQLNYHAAHDIGHALQEYMLVSCSSFAAWDGASADSTLIIGRNFDFYVGDDFARNKIVLFVEPDEGYRYASVTWPGMTGVVSGMNEKGLTVTINAAKGPIPLSSATPVSLLVRRILQYADSIEEAYAIALTVPTFVSEAILVGSAEDHRASIIEKTPEQIGLFAPEKVSEIICTNHYQGDHFKTDKYNLENIAVSDSRYRYERLSELLDGNRPLDVNGAVSVLRDHLGKKGKDVGLCNEMTVNQSIAHHSVVFKPEELKMWVSTSPWQSGPMVCYDLKKIFSGEDSLKSSYAVDSLMIPADTSFMDNCYSRVVAYRDFCTFVKETGNHPLSVDEDMIPVFINLNPEFYETYELAGDYYLAVGQVDKAVHYWKKSLEKEIPRVSYRERIQEKLKRYDKK